jgi:sec-independent protein translocase protein TatA
MPNLGPTELIIILLIVVLLFGARKIPEIAKGLGKGIKDFKGALKEGDAPAADETKSVSKPAEPENRENRPSA